MEQIYRFSAEVLQRIAQDVLTAGGSPTEEAALVSGRLVKANLTGHDSHGVIRLHQYMDWVRDGRIKPGQKTDIVRDNGSTAVMNGNSGFGQTAATAAMKTSISRAREHQVAAIGVTGLNHIGRLADYVLMAAAEGMIALCFTSTGGFSKLVAPFGGSERRMSTNPLACAFPSDRETPVVFDFASSAYAEGKFKVMRDAKMQTPPGILLDKDGQPSTEPEDLYAGGAILPVGGAQGYKGYMLNFMIEVLGGLLTGGGFLQEEAKPGLNNCSLMIVLNVSAYRELPAFKAELNQLIDYLKATRPSEHGPVLAPGEKEAKLERERLAGGVPLARATAQAIQSELDHFGLGGNLLEQGTLSDDPAWKF